MTTDILIDGLAFAEGPRWRDDRLYFSDVAAGLVHSVDMAGSLKTEAELPGRFPSGLGWLPDGTLLIAQGDPAAVVRADGSVYADLADVAAFAPNDMIVDTRGRVFVGTCDIAGIATGAPSPGQLIQVDPDGAVTVVDADMRFPNGPVVTPDGNTLIVAETFGNGLMAFDVSGDGPARNKRQWASVPGSVPDGICLDAEGAVWFADALGQKTVRVREGGEVTAEVAPQQACFACTLGGDDMRTLFILTGAFTAPEQNLRNRPGRIEFVTVDVPGAGSP